MNTGYSVSSPFSRSASGVSTSSPPPIAISTPTGASRPDSVGAGLFAGSVAAAQRAEAAFFVEPSGAGELESHIIGFGASNTGPFAPWSTAWSPPSAVVLTSMPSAASLRRSSASVSLFAACADFTTSSWVNPSSWASIRRSTSGRTLLYVAVAPSSSGAGRSPGHDRASSRPAFFIRTSGARPPPENARPMVLTFGATSPSPDRVNAVSIGFHSPPTRALTGRRYSRASRFPSGVAKTSRLSPRSDITSTGRPVRFAAS